MSMDEIRAITDLGNVFSYNGEITSFDELRYFTGLEKLNLMEFQLCTSLRSIIIPKNVTDIPLGALTDCSSLQYLSVEPENTIYDSRDNCNAIIKTDGDELVAGCENTIIPNTVTQIMNYAFRGNQGLKRITIPAGVTFIGDQAFNYCPNLTRIDIKAATPPEIQSGPNSWFSNVENCSICVPWGCKSVYQQTDMWEDFQNIFEMQPLNEYLVAFNFNDDCYSTEDASQYFFYEGAHNFNDKFGGAVWIQKGLTFENGLQLESTTRVHFINYETATVTIVLSTWSENTITVDGTEMPWSAGIDGTNCRIFTIEDMPSGIHTITRTDKENGLLAILVNLPEQQPWTSDIAYTRDDTTWDWADVTGDITNGQANSIVANDEEVILENYPRIYDNLTFGENFHADQISFKGENPVRPNHYCQNGTLRFFVTSDGYIAIDFSDTASSAGDGQKRYLNVCGQNTNYYTMRDGTTDRKTVSWIPVKAGPVTICGRNEDNTQDLALRIYCMKYITRDNAPTGITDALTSQPSNYNASDSRNSLFYNLQGQRVLHPQKGIYITNGKKILAR